MLSRLGLSAEPPTAIRGLSSLILIFVSVVKTKGDRVHPCITNHRRNRNGKTKALFRRLVLPEEDKAHRTSTGWRWFKSPNVIDLVRILRERGKLRNRAE